MHALWSRATQAQSSCRCRVCLHTVTTLTRRSTTAASRRRVTAADIFTACYTTILGTAAVLDAHRKEVRKKDLDKKLEKARSALSSLAIQEAPSRDEGPARNALDHRPSPSEGSITTPEWEAGISLTSTASLLGELGNIFASTYRSGTRSWLQHQIDWVAVEAAISAEEQDSGIALRHPHTDIQMERTTYTIEALVQRLLRRCRESIDQNTQNAQSTEGRKEKSILDKVEKLRAGPYHPCYENPCSNPAGATEARALLNESFRRIFNNATDVTEIVGKICYNLLLSSTPPNIQNYNALIAGFNRIQRPDLAQAVVDSYLIDTKWPATQQTMVCLLNHAVATNDIEQFRNVVSRMRGVAEDGLHFRILSKNAIFNSHGLLWAEANCASRKHAWVERAKRGGDVFDTLIRGCLHFGNANAAGMFFVACLREGRFVSVDTIKDLLSQCLSTFDHQIARQLIKGLAKNFENFEALMKIIHSNSPVQMARSITEMFYSLFDLSGLPYTTIIDGVKTSLWAVLCKFKSLDIVTQVQIELDEIESASRGIMRSLGTGNPYSTRSGASRALTTLAGEPQHSRINAMPVKGLGIPQLAALLQRYQSLEEKTMRIEAHVKVSIIYILTGIHCDTRSRLPPVEWQNRRYGERYPAVSRALRSINLKELSSGKNDLRRQFLRGLPNQELAKQLEDSGCWQKLEFGALMSLYQSGPNASKRVRAEHEQTSLAVIEVERQLEDVEDAIRAILFSFLKKGDQRNFRIAYPNWYKMPIAKLYEYHQQRIDHVESLPSSGTCVSVEVEEEANVVEMVGSPEGAPVLAPITEQRPLVSGGWPCIRDLRL